ncbi:phage holin family protein [Aeromicrobium alkaliterrae]|uniref:Phage holin family protein n=1 Tax=Aeromicrobium alkaliterrae TaxID=302168 RepID=A0ABN2JZ92_9ACTN
MERFLSTWVASSVALAFAAWLLGDHMDIGEPSETMTNRVLAVLLVGLFFTVVSMFVAPVVKLLSLPFIILSLGLALLVINALMLLLVEAISDGFGVHFVLDGFWWAVLASVVISIAQAVVRAFLPEGD